MSLPDPHAAATALLWTLVLAVAGLMAWRLSQAFGRQAGAGRPLRYWYYGPIFAILTWLVAVGGVPDYWKTPYSYPLRAALWIGLCFLVGEAANLLAQLAWRALRRHGGRRASRAGPGRRGRGR